MVAARIDRKVFVKTQSNWNGKTKIVYRGFIEAYDNLYDGVLAVGDRIKMHIESELGTEGKLWKFMVDEDEDSEYQIYGKPLELNRDGERRYILWYPIEYSEVGYHVMSHKYGPKIIQHQVQKDPKKLSIVMAHRAQEA